MGALSYFTIVFFLLLSLPYLSLFFLATLMPQQYDGWITSLFFIFFSFLFLFYHLPSQLKTKLYSYSLFVFSCSSFCYTPPPLSLTITPSSPPHLSYNLIIPCLTHTPLFPLSSFPLSSSLPFSKSSPLYILPFFFSSSFLITPQLVYPFCTSQ